MAWTDDEDVVEIFTLIQKWHASRIGQLKEILGTPADTTIILRNKGDESGTTLDAAQAAAYRAGLLFALDLFGSFPLKIEASQPEEDEEG